MLDFELSAKFLQRHRNEVHSYDTFNEHNSEHVKDRSSQKNRFMLQVGVKMSPLPRKNKTGV